MRFATKKKDVRNSLEEVVEALPIGPAPEVGHQKKYAHQQRHHDAALARACRKRHDCGQQQLPDELGAEPPLLIGAVRLVQIRERFCELLVVGEFALALAPRSHGTLAGIAPRGLQLSFLRQDVAMNDDPKHDGHWKIKGRR